MDSYSKGLSGSINTMLMFLSVLEMRLTVWSATDYSVLLEVTKTIYFVEYNS